MMQKKNSFSLLDFAVAMVIFSILLAAFLPRWGDYNRWLSRLKTQFGFEEQYLVFRIQLEEDFYNALLHQTYLIDNFSDNFQMENWTINYSTGRLEKRLAIYQFHSDDKNIRRKTSTLGSPQPVLEGVELFQYHVFRDLDRICLRLELKSILEDMKRIDSLCRNL